MNTYDLFLDAKKNDAVNVLFVTGEMGQGKTSLALYTLYNIYHSWAKALYYTYFEPEDYFGQNNQDKVDALLFDDAGLWLPKNLWHKKDVITFTNLLNVTRDFAYMIIFTTPSEDLPLAILRKVNYRAKVISHCNTDINDKPASCAILYRAVYDIQKGRFEYIVLTKIFYPKYYPNDVKFLYDILRKYKVSKYKQKVKTIFNIRDENELAKIKTELNPDIIYDYIKRLGGTDKEYRDFMRKIEIALNR